MTGFVCAQRERDSLTAAVNRAIGAGASEVSTASLSRRTRTTVRSPRFPTILPLRAWPPPGEAKCLAGKAVAMGERVPSAQRQFRRLNGALSSGLRSRKL